MPNACQCLPTQSPHKASQFRVDVDFPAIFNAISAVIAVLNPPPPAETTIDVRAAVPNRTTMQDNCPRLALEFAFIDGSARY